MKRSLIIVLIFVAYYSIGQTSVKKNNSSYTEATFSVAGNEVHIQNSLPKGGGRYTDRTGRTFSYVIFWYRIVNKSNKPMELNIRFPSDSLTFFPSPDQYIKISMPLDTMKLEKESMFDYGITNLKYSLDKNFFKPTRLMKTIKPKEESLFYIAMLFYYATGSARTELVLKEQKLFYNIKVGSEQVIIPCGSFTTISK
ncbi:MAG: hypothetical protein ACK5RG_21385 [Cyclobacteriaceae bacterium]